MTNGMMSEKKGSAFLTEIIGEVPKKTEEQDVTSVSPARDHSGAGAEETHVLGVALPPGGANFIEEGKCPKGEPCPGEAEGEGTESAGIMYIVYVVSDALGETAELVCRAAAAQFAGARTKIRKIPYVRNILQLDDVLAEAAEENAIVLYTLVVDELRGYLQEKAIQYSLVAVDVLGPLVEAISTRINKSPKSVPDITNRLDAQYFKKIEAIEFAVKYDDGKDPRGLLYADVVLVGVSRTSKTPLSMYLAHKGIKVANIPLVPEVAPPRELFILPARKVFALILDPNKLNEIRGERLKTLGLGVSADYASLDRIMEELHYADQIIKKIGCMVINTTHRAIEETASIILHKIYKGE